MLSSEGIRKAAARDDELAIDLQSLREVLEVELGVGHSGVQDTLSIMERVRKHKATWHLDDGDTGAQG